MKLYFYHLSQPLGEKPRIEVEECEVEERPKTYKPLGEFPSYHIGCYVLKSDIGTLSGDTVILTEKNCKKVAKIFIESLHRDIEREQERIEGAKKEIEKSYDLIDIVDDWRAEHETN